MCRTSTDGTPSVPIAPMKLAKYRLPTGQTGVGRVEGDHLLPFDLSGGQYRSLFEILEADNPYEAAEFLTSGDERDSAGAV